MKAKNIQNHIQSPHSRLQSPHPALAMSNPPSPKKSPPAREATAQQQQQASAARATLSTSTSSFEALDPHDPQLNHLASLMFSKSAEWMQVGASTCFIVESIP